MGLQFTGFVTLLPLFARRFESFGAGVAELGVSAMAYALTSTIAAPFIGMIADRYGRRPIILFSLVAYMLAFSGYLLATAAWMLILFRGLAGAFTAGLTPAVMSSVGDLAPEDRRGQWIGIVNGGASAGWIFGPLLGGLLYDNYGHVVPFAASIAMAACALLIAIMWIPETHVPLANAGDEPRLNLNTILQALSFRPVFFVLLTITFGVTFAWAFIEPQFMFYAYESLSWTSAQLGLVMSAYGVAFTAGEFVLGRLSDRLGRKPVLILGLALFSSQFVGLVAFQEAAWIGVSFILAGLGNALFDPALSATILDLAPPEQTASLIGFKSTAGSLGSLLGPALVVLVTPFAGPQVVFLMSATLVFVLTLTAALALRIQNVSAVASRVPEIAGGQ
jgi:DHA1 family tetracycline resistance protein-like MFS transporter